jgi:hypothetical protein
MGENAVFRRTRVVIVLSLAALVNSAVGQNIGPSPPLLQDVLPERVEEIRETPNGISVRGSLVQPDGRNATCLVFICTRSGLDNGFYFAIQDHATKTDDRTAVEASFCNNFRIAVRQRLDA